MQGTIDGDGTYLVGVDIQPGTYRTTGSAMTARCYWERLADTSGTTLSIIANELTFGPATVTIAESDDGGDGSATVSPTTSPAGTARPR